MARQEIVSLEHIGTGAHGPSRTEAYLMLGIRYATGRDVEPDLVEAHKWFNIAAAQGDRLAIDYRREIAREMSPAQIREAQRQAREWAGMS